MFCRCYCYCSVVVIVVVLLVSVRVIIVLVVVPVVRCVIVHITGLSTVCVTVLVTVLDIVPFVFNALILASDLASYSSHCYSCHCPMRVLLFIRLFLLRYLLLFLLVLCSFKRSCYG